MTRSFDAIVFDAFGTLMEIQRPLRPYATLRAALQACSADTTDLPRQAMTSPLTLAALAQRAGVPLPGEVLIPLEEAIDREVASIAVFPDAAVAIERALACADRVVVASNLAQPYSKPVEHWLRRWGEVEKLSETSQARLLTAFSFDLGLLKPDAAFYADVASRLSFVTGKPASALRLAMVGDKNAEDCDGPRAAGWQAHRLNRSAGQVLLDAPWWPRPHACFSRPPRLKPVNSPI